MALLGTATGTINVAGEHDWFKLNLNANTLYALTSTNGLGFAVHDANGEKRAVTRRLGAVRRSVVFRCRS